MTTRVPARSRPLSRAPRGRRLTLLPVLAVTAGAVLAGCGAPDVAAATDRGTPDLPPMARAAADVPSPLGLPVPSGAGLTAAQAPPRPPAARTSTPDPALANAAEGLRPFLLAPAEVGPGFVGGEEPKPDPATPAICGGPGVVAQYPIAVRVGAGFENPAVGRVQQTVSVYADGVAAADAHRAGARGMDCGQGTVDGGPVVVTPAEDLRADLGRDEATGWRVGGRDFDVLIISVRADAVVMTFTFLAPEGGLGAFPDPLGVARAGLRKLLG